MSCSSPPGKPPIFRNFRPMSSLRLKSALTLLGPFIALLVVYTVFGLQNPAMFTRDVVFSILT